MSQEELSKIFTESELAKSKTGLPLEGGWGSACHGDKDSLWDSNTDTHWERNHPDGEWHVVPPMGAANANRT